MNQENNLNQMSFEVPFDMIELPSKGLLYPNGQHLVKVEYLTASDENILTSPNLIKNGKVIDVLMERKLKNPPVEYRDLLLGDRNAILIWLRATGYGEMYPVRLIDPSNGEEFETEINLQDLKTKTLEVEPDENFEFKFMLPMSKKLVKFKLLTVGDENDIISRTEKYKKVTKSQISNMLTYRLERQIKEIDGIRDLSKIAQYIQVMPALDSLKLRNYIDEIDPGIELEAEVEGPSGEPFRSPITIGRNFFWPNAGV